MFSEDVAQIINRGQRVVAGMYQAYGHEWRRLPTAAQWHKHPFTDHEFSTAPWWRVVLLPAGHDVKDVWEPGRFSWVYDLIRAHSLTGDPVYCRSFHEHLARWQAVNIPFLGPQWACGQETAIRALAILHGEDALPPPADDGLAAQRIVTVLCWSGERIADAIGYGLSQRNNHGISEAAGLVHLGLRLQGVHAGATRWLAAGKKWLEEQICDQFAADGWYAQHSFTYMRVALEQALLAQRALRMSNSSLSEASLLRLVGSYELLLRLVDARTGVVPNHGANDGARTVPYSSAAYRDFRPLLTLAALVLDRPLPQDIPADTQVLRWLGLDIKRGAHRGDGVWTGKSGWAVARIGAITVFLRAGAYTHRPSDLDTLHLDVRFGSAEIITDPGTFAYNAAPPWNKALTSAAVHNGPIVDGADIARRGPRFLWYSWPYARVLESKYKEGYSRLVAEIPGRVRRTVDVSADGVHVTDLALDPQARTLQTTWLLHPEVDPQEWIDAAAARLIRAEEGDVTGWFSPTYGLRQSSTAVRIESARREGSLSSTVSIRPRRRDRY